MSEAIDASRGDFDDPLAGPTYVIGLVGTVILIATVLLVHTLSNNLGGSVQDEQLERDYFEITEVQSEQREQLEGSTWTIPTEDRVSIPIEEGVERVLQRYGTNH